MQAGVLHEDGQLHAACAKAGCLHGDAMRSDGGLQGSSGEGLLPDAEMLRSPEGVRSGVLQLG
jgi:hypothetical protein